MAFKKNTVMIMRAPSQCGKTLYANKAKAYLGSEGVECKIVSADHYFVNEHNEYRFDPSKLAIAHNQCFGNFMRIVTSKPASRARVVIVDNTNTRRWEYENYKLLALHMGWDVVLYEILPETREGLLTVLGRYNGHDVPKEVITRQWVEFQADCSSTALPENRTKRVRIWPASINGAGLLDKKHLQ